MGMMKSMKQSVQALFFAAGAGLFVRSASVPRECHGSPPGILGQSQTMRTPYYETYPGGTQGGFLSGVDVDKDIF